MNSAKVKQLKAFQKKIKYKFRDSKLLETAFTRKSHAFEQPKGALDWNERLEFFGDSVLGFVISEYLYKKFKNFQEGELTKLK